jgi:Ni,Fe-hydrogenase III component G
MTREEVIADLKSRFGDDILDFADRSPNRLYIEIRPRSITWIGTYIFRDLRARFNIATGSDIPGAIEIIYHFTIEDIDLMVNLRVRLPKEKPEIHSLAGSIWAFDWIEREMHELLGIEFTGHPDPRRLLLPDNWPDGVYPLRQDYREWDETAVRDRGV